jgi:O-antigen/teichoic acid export membrane protein
MSLSGLARGLRAHFIDHAFHLSGRPLMMLWTYVPATIINIALNLVVVPRYGMFGAAWTALLCQTFTVVAGWFLGTSLFPVWLPFGQVVRVVLAVMPMVVALEVIEFPYTWGGLLASVLIGGTLYIVSALVLNVGEVRSIGFKALRRRFSPRPPDQKPPDQGALRKFTTTSSKPAESVTLQA